MSATYGMVWSCAHGGLHSTAMALFGLQSDWTLLTCQAEPVAKTIEEWAKLYSETMGNDKLRPSYETLEHVARPRVWSGDFEASFVALRTENAATFAMFFEDYWRGEEHIGICGEAPSREELQKALCMARDGAQAVDVALDVVLNPRAAGKLSVWFGAPSADSNGILVLSDSNNLISQLASLAHGLGHVDVKDFENSRAPWLKNEDVNFYYRCDPEAELRRFLVIPK